MQYLDNILQYFQKNHSNCSRIKAFTSEIFKIPLESNTKKKI